MIQSLATVTEGKYKHQTVAPYIKLKFGYLCDLGNNNKEIIEEEYLRFWKNVSKVEIKNYKIISYEK